MKSSLNSIRTMLLMLAAMFALALLTMLPPHSHLQTPDDEVVTSPSQTFTVTNSDPSGAGSLAQAITSANGNAGLDTINFNVPGSGIQFFFTMATLPAVTDPVVIDGTTQPGYAGTPLIHIEGLGISRSLDITGGGTTVKGLSFTSNSAGASSGIVRLSGGGNNVITGCAFGVRGDSTRPSTSSMGVLIESNGNRVGGTTATERNYFAVTNEHQLVIQNGAANNRVTGNWFGTAPNGTRLATSGRDAIRILNSPNNTIGGSTGTTPGGACTGECNVIAGAGNNGVFVNGATATGNRVIGNFVGLFAAGNSVNANNLGIRIENAPNNTVGGTTVAERNVITGNSGLAGVMVTGAGSTGSVISGNYIGLFSSGTSTPASGNTLDGILLNASSTGTRIGGTTAGERNVISGLAANGIEIAASNSNSVLGNYIGTDASGIVRSTTVINGILIAFSDNNTIGGTEGTTLGGACTGACNVISGNGNNGTGDGITLNTANGNTIDGCYIGVNAAGTDALVNGRTPSGSTYSGHAIGVYTSNNTVIGRQTLDVTSNDPPDVPAANYCIQNPETGDYVSFNDNAPVQYFAIHCKSGNSITGFGSLIETETFKSLVSDAAQADVRGIIDDNEGWANATFPDGYELYVYQPAPFSTSCSCPQKGMNVIGGPVQLGQTNEPANGTRLSRTLIGKKANGKGSLDELFQTHSFIRNQSGSGNTFDHLEVNSGQDPGIKIEGGTGNSIGDVQFQTQNEPVVVTPGANGDVQPPSELLIARVYVQGVGERFIGTLQGLPNTTYVIRFWTYNQNVEGPPTYDPLALVGFTVTTDQNGGGLIDHTFVGITALFIGSIDYLSATATIQGGSLQGSTSGMSTPSRVPVGVYDFDSDGKTDPAVVRAGASTVAWYIQESINQSLRQAVFGAMGDMYLPGDYNGDRLTDLAVWRPQTGIWYIGRPVGNPAQNFEAIQFGLPTDKPIGRFDYDGDHRADPTVFRESTGTWYIRGSLSGLQFTRQWGLGTDKLAPGDYNGDAHSDVGVFRDGTWYLNTCPTCPLLTYQFGINGDIPVPADWDGDGRTDVGVYRPSEGNWYLWESMKGFRAYHWGTTGDIPLNIDIDADGKNDIGVFRPSTGDWWVLKSSNGQALGFHWGQTGDIPVPKF